MYMQSCCSLCYTCYASWWSPLGKRTAHLQDINGAAPQPLLVWHPYAQHYFAHTGQHTICPHSNICCMQH